MRQGDEGAPAIPHRNPGKMAARRGKEGLPEIAMNDAEPGATIEEHAVARIRSLENGGGAVRSGRIGDEAASPARSGIENAGRRAEPSTLKRLEQRAINRHLHRHVPVGRAAPARMPALVIGVKAERVNGHRLES